jgi:bromodomain and PHD finger-containing protein 1
VSELGEFYRQIKYLQCLRQDLEKARLLCELVRKREKKKNELTRAKETSLLVELCPMKYFLNRVWELISSKDTNAIFMEPVDVTEVPDYTDVVKHPMDLSTMKNKIDNFQYRSLDNFEDDFNLMVSNCLAYNSKDTIFYRAGLRIRDQGGNIIKSAKADADLAGLDEETGTFLPPGAAKPIPKVSDEQISCEIDERLAKLPTSDMVSWLNIVI